MIYSPTPKEFESILKLDIDKRVKHFRNRVGGHCYFWACIDNGDFLAGYDSLGRECICVWPAKEYALSLVSSKDLQFLNPIGIHTFLDEYIDELQDQKVSILVFPTEQGGALFSPYDFKNMMEEELARYGDYD